mmetsp:Transcript_32686/g.47979  ORF Transcript_32686/g.47979 Transcript_32686/m.47979 type:complete len:383 (-) Transcript_32686:31-1179(-)
MTDDVGMHFRHASPLDELIELAENAVAGDRLHVGDQVFHFGLKELREAGVLQGFVPEGADVHAAHLWGVDDFAKRPHHGAVHAHQLRRGDGVRLVEHHANFIVVALEREQDALELVRDVEFVSIEEHQDAIGSVGEPLHDFGELVVAVVLLLGPSQHTGGVDDRQLLQQLGLHLRALEAVQEATPKLGQRRERFVGLHNEGVAGNDALVAAVHDGHETVGGRFRADADTGEVTLQDVLDERSLTSGVLADKHDEGHGVEVRVLQEGVEELVEEIHLLDVLHVLPVKGLEPIQHGGVHAVFRVLEVGELPQLSLVQGVLLLEHLEQLGLAAAVRLQHGVDRRELLGGMVLVELNQLLSVRHGGGFAGDYFGSRSEDYCTSWNR